MVMSPHVIKKYAFGIAPFVFFVGISVYFYIYSTPTGLVNLVGIENAYLLMFFVAFLGGLTTFNTVPYYSVLLILTTAGLSPLLLGLSSATGVMGGDSTSYYMGYQGGGIVPSRLRNFFIKLHTAMARYPRAFPFFCFAYGALSPFSNDFITIPAGLARYPFARVMLPLAMGNLVFNIGLAYAATYTYNFVLLFI